VADDEENERQIYSAKSFRCSLGTSPNATDELAMVIEDFRRRKAPTHQVFVASPIVGNGRKSNEFPQRQSSANCQFVLA